MLADAPMTEKHVCAFGTFYLEPDHLQHESMQVSISTYFTNRQIGTTKISVIRLYSLDFKAVKRQFSWRTRIPAASMYSILSLRKDLKFFDYSHIFGYSVP